MDTKIQDNTTPKPEANEPIDFSSLHGLACGPEGCALPKDFYNRPNKTKDNDKD